MRSVVVLSICSILLCSAAFGALSTNAGSALSFYRSAESLFPSGQANRSILEDKIVRTEMEISYRIAWDNKEYTLLGSHLLRDVQTAHSVETKSTVRLLSLNQSNAPAIKTLSAKAALVILEAGPYWARVRETNSSPQEGWLPIHLLQVPKEDKGVFVNIIDTYLRDQPRIPSSILTTLPRMRRFQALGFEKGFVKVKFESHVGYADINHFVSRADFANLAFHSKKQWQAVTHRDNEYLVTTKGDKLPLTEIRGYITNPLRGIMSTAESSYGPQLRSRVDIIRPQAYIWGVSSLPGHGQVWWKKKDLLLEEKTTDSTSISTEQLMKREIYSIAFESKDSLKGLVSAEGVYRTEDGQTWTLIPQFEKHNYPVSIHPNGSWFIGSYKSINKGKSFEPFIRWDLIAEAIEGAYHRNPKTMKITRIEALPNSQIEIFVDTGIERIKLRSSLANLNWQVVKN